MALLAFTPSVASREDLGRHLLLGRIITEHGRVPDTNLLTYTNPDFPFVDHHWLSEVVLYELHRLGGLNGLIVWQMAMMTGALAIALRTVPPPRRRLGAYWLAGIGAAVMMAYRAEIRPELFTFVAVALYGWLFERIRRGNGWARGVLLAVAAAWANLHIYFVFGVGMAGAFVVERVWRDPRRDTRLREAGWFAALVAVSCLGPNGVRGFLYPLRIFSNYGLDPIENTSPLGLWASVLNPMLVVLPLFSLATVVAVARLWWPGSTASGRRLADAVAALAALVAAWSMARSVPLLALTGLPVIGAALSTPSRRPSSLASVFRSGAVVAAVLLTAVVAHGAIDGWYTRVFPTPIYPTPLGFDDERRYERLRELVERYGLAGPVLTDYNAGSLVEYQLHPERGYVDNRPEAFPASFWHDEYPKAMAPGPEWDRLRDLRQWNTAVVSFAVPNFIQALRRRSDWTLVSVDDVFIVFVRNDARNGSLIEARRYDARRADADAADVAARIDGLARLPWWRRNVEAERALYQLYGLVLVGEAQRAWPGLARLHALYPDYQLVHELMQVAAPASEREELFQVMRRRARWPVSVKQVLDWGSVLVRDGRIEDAKAVLARGRFFFPLSPELRDALARAPRS
jgi:hypothetical protein